MLEKINPPENAWLSKEEDKRVDEVISRFSRYQNIHWDEFADSLQIAELSGKTVQEIDALKQTESNAKIIEDLIDEKDRDNLKLSVLADNREEMIKSFFDDYSDEYSEEEAERLREWL
jgi:hypothetical protein